MFKSCMDISFLNGKVICTPPDQNKIPIFKLSNKKRIMRHPVVPLLLRKQAEFRRRKPIVDHVTLPTHEIEDSFLTKNKAGAVFVDLTAAYDTLWHPTGIDLVLLLFNIFTHYQLTITTIKFVFADDMAILPSASNWQAFEGTLAQYRETLSSYLQK